MIYQGFPNGMTLQDGVSRAAKWWDDIGRELIAGMTESTPVNEKGKMMAGSKFDDLNTKERHKIVVVWYENIGKHL